MERRASGGAPRRLQGPGDVGVRGHDRRGRATVPGDAAPGADIGKRRRQRGDGGMPSRILPSLGQHAARFRRGKELRTHGLGLHQLTGHSDDCQRSDPRQNRHQLQGRHVWPRISRQRLHRPFHTVVLHERFRRASGHPGPGHVGQPLQVHSLHRRERGGFSLGSLAREPGVPARG